MYTILKNVKPPYFSNGLTNWCHATYSILPNILPKKITNIIKRNWNQFLLVVKATTLKQQISKFYPQILSTEALLNLWQATKWHKCDC